jgi:ribosome-associated protein
VSTPALDTLAIRLDQFLKLTGLADTGGQAKVLVQSGHVKVNGEIERRRGRKLRTGDKVEVGDRSVEVSVATVGSEPGAG